MNPITDAIPHGFRGARTRHVAAFEVPAPPERVFPLLCPIREEEWIDGWTGRVIHSESGLAEPDGVFVAGREEPLLFVVSRYEQPWRIEYVELSAGKWVQRLALSLAPVAGGTRVEISRVYTGLSEQGNLEIERMAGPKLEETTAGIGRALDRHCRMALRE